MYAIIIDFVLFYFSEHTNHFAESIITYFDTALATMLLYAVERAQYKEVKYLFEFYFITENRRF
jgi:hypothetical protein